VISGLYVGVFSDGAVHDLTVRERAEVFSLRVLCLDEGIAFFQSGMLVRLDGARHGFPVAFVGIVDAFVATELDCDDFLQFPIIQGEAAHEADVHAQPPVRPGTVEAAEGPERLAVRLRLRRRHHQGGPRGLLVSAVAAHLVVWLVRDRLEALLQLRLGRLRLLMLLL